MSLSVPALFAPHVRLELLRWDPLYADAAPGAEAAQARAQREAGMLVREGQPPPGAGAGDAAAREGVYRSFDKQAWCASSCTRCLWWSRASWVLRRCVWRARAVLLLPRWRARGRRYECLFDFGIGHEGGEGLAAHAHEDPDANLVPDLVRKLVLPLAEHMVER